MSRTIASLAFLALAACRAAEGPAPVPVRADPERFRVETVLYELPLARAEALSHPADPEQATFGFDVDDRGSREQVERLARSDPDVLRVERPALVVAPGTRARVPARSRAARGETRERESDRIELEVRPSVSDGWTPVDLELSIRWLSPGGGEIGSLPRGSAPLPEGLPMRFVCLPARSAGAASSSDESRAVIGFLRVLPLPAR